MIPLIHKWISKTLQTIKAESLFGIDFTTFGNFNKFHPFFIPSIHGPAIVTFEQLQLRVLGILEKGRPPQKRNLSSAEYP